MTKKAMINFISDHYDWFERMQEGLGSSSWWYTNRSSEDCIDVKLHSWFDIDDLKAKLTKKEQKIIEQINYDLEEVINFFVWEIIISDARDELEYDLKKKFSVDRVEYGGRSGGWLAVVYNWDEIPSDFDDGDYTYQEVKKFYHIIKNAIEENEQVVNFVLKRKKKLDKFLSNADNFIDEVKTCLYDTLEAKQAEAKELLKIKV